MRPELPTGTVTFLFTDVEASTDLLRQMGSERYAEALAEHRRVLRAAFARHSGVEVDTQGDAFFVAFATAPDAVAAAEEGQQALAPGPIQVRMGLHTGAALVTKEGYVGQDVHRAARIAASGHGGQVLVSAATASLLGLDSVRDLGEHRLKDLAAAERIYQLGWDDFPPLKTLERTNLPVPATPFLGRERELAEVAALLAGDNVRLLTLTGPAGGGKTRLALQAAAEVSDKYPDGVFWAPLGALRDADLVLDVAAQALSARNGLSERISDRRILLLLDNFEHVISAAENLADLLAACPNLRLLVTSRELLRLPGEQVYPLLPLQPADASELFTARARAVDPAFLPGPAVTELCSRLDNLPLALELAAARVAVLSPEQLLERLSKRLDLLRAGRGVDPRQQTLRATIEWSCDLLGEEERELFERLSVFREGCTLEAAESVCKAEIDTLQSLLDKSLLRRQGERFVMLETIREFAAERLEERADVDELGRLHAHYFLARAEEAARGGTDQEGSPEETAWLRPELANIRHALAWFVDAGDNERELRLATAAFWGLWTRTSLQELKSWLVSALDRSAKANPGLRAAALGAVALAAANTRDPEGAREYARESLALARQRGDKRQIEWALRVLSFDEADLEERRRLLEECGRLLRELGNDAGLAWVAFLRGQLLLEQGSHDRARQTFMEAAAIFGGLGRRWEQANAEIEVARVLILGGRDEEAGEILEGALGTAVELDSRGLSVEALVGLACVRVSADPVAAVRLVSAALSIGEESGTPLYEHHDPLVTTVRESARAQLGDRFEAEWEAGKALPLNKAIALALGDETAALDSL